MCSVVMGHPLGCPGAGPRRRAWLLSVTEESVCARRGPALTEPGKAETLRVSRCTITRSLFAEALHRAHAIVRDATALPGEMPARADVLATITEVEASLTSTTEAQGQPIDQAPPHGVGETEAACQSEPPYAMDRGLLDVICHDLTALLAPISIGAAFLERTNESEPRSPATRKIIDVIVRSADRLNQLVVDLRDVSRMEQRRFTVARCSCDAATLLDAAFDQLVPLAAGKSLKVEKHSDASGSAVECDGERILQAFSKLFDNALCHTPTGGTIRLSATRGDGCVRFSVSDTGCGMDPERLAHAFDRTWHATQRARSGAGLGLAITRGIVLAHDGRIDIESASGAGTTVTFTIPCGGAQRA